MNKQKPKLKCKGSCHLNKIISGNENAPQSNAPLPQKYTLELNLEFDHSNHQNIERKDSEGKKILFPDLKSVCNSGFPDTYFHPPEWAI